MRYWLFQFNPKTFKWFNWLNENRETEQWLVSRHAHILRRGDKVAIWASGGMAGIYAIGEVLAPPLLEPVDPIEGKYFTDRLFYTRFRQYKSVKVKHLKRITDRPILRNECKQDSVLSGLEVLKGRQATNIRMTEKQWNRIVELIEQRAG